MYFLKLELLFCILFLVLNTCYLDTQYQVLGDYSSCLAAAQWLIGRQRPLCGPSQRKAEGGPKEKKSPSKKSGDKKKVQAKTRVIARNIAAPCVSNSPFLSINFAKVIQISLRIVFDWLEAT